MRFITLGTLFISMTLFLSACEPPESRTFGDPHYEEPAAMIEKNDFLCEGLDSDKGGVPVEVVRLDDGHCYPQGIFANFTPPDKCKYDHYHYTLLSLDGHYRYEEDPDCGAATSEDINHTGIYYTTHKQVTEWNELWRQRGIVPVEIEFDEPKKTEASEG